jgi:integrase
MMPSKSARVLGPYRNGDKWRVVIFDESGRKALLAPSREEAEKLKSGLSRMVEDRSLINIGAALDEWLEHKTQSGIKPISVRMIRRRLSPFLPTEKSLGELTPQLAAKLYLDETKRQGRRGVVRPATHHKTLGFAKELFGWAVERGYLRDNPFAKVKRLGRASTGKLQLREDEARRLNAVLLKAGEHDDAALALLVQLVMALRSGEVLGLRVRDLDADATVLVIEGTKTRNARRRLEIKSDPLRQLLSRRCARRAPGDLIFGNGRGASHHTNYLHKALEKYCQQAGVPVVCPHSLRGLHSSIAVTRGASSQLVAEALGHGTDAITRKHYISPEALDSARMNRIAEALNGKPATPDLSQLEILLRQLAPEQLQSLIASVAKSR